MFAPRGFAAIDSHRATERAIHLACFPTSAVLGLFCPAIVDKLVAMPPDSDAWAGKFNLIRPQKCAFKGAIIGPKSC